MRVGVQLLNFTKLTSDPRNTSCRRGKCRIEMFIAEVFIFTAEFTDYTGHGVTGQTFKDIPMRDHQTTILRLCATSGNRSQYKVIVMIHTLDFSVSTSRILSLIHLPLYMFLVRSLTTKLQSSCIQSTVYLYVLILDCNKCNYLTWRFFFKFLTLRLWKGGRRVLSVQL